MTPETLSLVAILLLALTAVSRGLALFGLPGPWSLATVTFRLGATLLLVVALGLLVATIGEWTPLYWKQLVVSLSIAILAIYQVMAWLLRLEGAAPLADLLALALIVASLLVTGPVTSAPDCSHDSAPFIIVQGLLLAGTASVAIMGCSSVLLGLVAAWGQDNQRPQWPGRDGLTHFLVQTNMLALLSLGFGLVLGIFWSWQTTGSLSSGDTGMAWMASIWLLAAMTNLARALQRHWLAWLVILAVVSASAAIGGLLIPPFLPGLL
jgi:hypothetical protein